MTNDNVIGAMPSTNGADLQVILDGDEIFFRAPFCYGVALSANEARQLAAWLVRGAAKLEWNERRIQEREGVR